jgi:hypothetical protein
MRLITHTLLALQATWSWMESAKQQSLKVVGTPQLSRYNPPWTLPMFRRNEIMVEVAAP